MENNIIIGSDALANSEATITISSGTSSFIYEPQFVDQEILEYNISENKKTIEIIIKQNQYWNWGYAAPASNSIPNERVIKRIYKIRNGKLKLFKEEVGEVIPPQHTPESYRFNEEKK